MDVPIRFYLLQAPSCLVCQSSLLSSSSSSSVHVSSGILRNRAENVLCNTAENCSPPLCGELFSALCGEQFSAIVLWSGCGETSPPSLLSQSHQVSIQFVSDRPPAEQQRGLQHHRPGAHGRLWRPAPRSHWHRELPQGRGNNI